MAQLAWKKDLVGICFKNRFEVGKKLHEHLSKVVKENESCNIIQDFNGQTDYIIEPQYPDKTIVDKDKNVALLIYLSPIKLKENQKLGKYQDLAHELEKNFGSCQLMLSQ